MTEKIYRVFVRITDSLQPSHTFWQRELVYCGTDRTQARVAYHRSEITDFGGGFGNSCRETISELISDAESDDFSDDPVQSIEED